MLGLAVGDAVGTTAEFKPRESFAPLTDMVGGGPFRLKAGQWTDDTAMALCLATSLIECGGFDARDQMDRYCRWWDEGYLSCTGKCFDIGVTVSSALDGYQRTGEPYSGSRDPQTAGNGSLMRLAPVVLFFHPDEAAIDEYAAKSSRTTHGADEAVDACRIFARMISAALGGAGKAGVLAAAGGIEASERLKQIAEGAYRGAPADRIRGTGYVVDCLEAALWAFEGTESFEAAILRAANLGDDADTTAAVCGQIAGAFYGLSGIPERWVQRVAMREEILGLADGLCSTP